MVPLEGRNGVYHKPKAPFIPDGNVGLARKFSCEPRRLELDLEPDLEAPAEPPRGGQLQVVLGVALR